MSTRGHHGLLLNAGGGGGGGGDPHWASVVSLLNFEGADGSTTFTDARGKTWTPSGDAQINDGGLLCDGAGDYISTPSSADFDFGSGDFTVEMYLSSPSPGSNQLAASKVESSYTPWGIGLFGGFLQMLVSTTGATWAATNADSGAFPTSTLQHVGLCREGTTMRLLRNGSVVASATVSGSLDVNTSAVVLGIWEFGAFPLNGRIKGWRVTKGVARYTGSYTPPSLPLPTS